MPSRDGRTGAAPEVQMAMVESDVHHLRDQTDRDRRATAERFQDFRQWRERVELSLATQAASVARVEDTTKRLESVQGKQTDSLAQLSGALRLAAWLAPIAVTLIELGLRLVLK